jgi:hypothetical protein
MSAKKKNNPAEDAGRLFRTVKEANSKLPLFQAAERKRRNRKIVPQWVAIR